MLRMTILLSVCVLPVFSRIGVHWRKKISPSSMSDFNLIKSLLCRFSTNIVTSSFAIRCSPEARSVTMLGVINQDAKKGARLPERLLKIGSIVFRVHSRHVKFLLT